MRGRMDGPIGIAQHLASEDGPQGFIAIQFAVFQAVEEKECAIEAEEQQRHPARFAEAVG